MVLIYHLSDIQANVKQVENGKGCQKCIIQIFSIFLFDFYDCKVVCCFRQRIVAGKQLTRSTELAAFIAVGNIEGFKTLGQMRPEACPAKSSGHRWSYIGDLS